jgi:hypothetical protein
MPHPLDFKSGHFNLGETGHYYFGATDGNKDLTVEFEKNRMGYGK